MPSLCHTHKRLSNNYSILAQPRAYRLQGLLLVWIISLFPYMPSTFSFVLYYFILVGKTGVYVLLNLRKYKTITNHDRHKIFFMIADVF